MALAPTVAATKMRLLARSLNLKLMVKFLPFYSVRFMGFLAGAWSDPWTRPRKGKETLLGLADGPDDVGLSICRPHLANPLLIEFLTAVRGCSTVHFLPSFADHPLAQLAAG